MIIIMHGESHTFQIVSVQKMLLISSPQLVFLESNKLLNMYSTNYDENNNNLPSNTLNSRKNTNIVTIIYGCSILGVYF